MKKIVITISKSTKDSAAYDASVDNLVLSIQEPCVVQIQGTTNTVVRYVRQENDLIIYFQDGTSIRVNGFFSGIAPESADSNSELVFNNEDDLTHVSFADIANVNSDYSSLELIPNVKKIDSIEPFFEESLEFGWGSLGASALLGALGGVLLNPSSKDGFLDQESIPSVKPVNNPTFIVLDDYGHQQGVYT